MSRFPARVVVSVVTLLLAALLGCGGEEEPFPSRGAQSTAEDPLACSGDDLCQQQGLGQACVLTEAGYRCVALRGEGEHCNERGVRCAKDLDCVRGQCLSAASPRQVGRNETCDEIHLTCEPGLWCMRRDVDGFGSCLTDQEL